MPQYYPGRFQSKFFTQERRGVVTELVGCSNPVTGTRSILGKEAAKVLLGHTKTETTDIYLLEEVQEAIKVAKLLASKTEVKRQPRRQS